MDEIVTSTTNELSQFLFKFILLFNQLAIESPDLRAVPDIENLLKSSEDEIQIKRLLVPIVQRVLLQHTQMILNRAGNKHPTLEDNLNLIADDITAMLRTYSSAGYTNVFKRPAAPASQQHPPPQPPEQHQDDLARSIRSTNREKGSWAVLRMYFKK